MADQAIKKKKNRARSQLYPSNWTRTPALPASDTFGKPYKMCCTQFFTFTPRALSIREGGGGGGGRGGWDCSRWPGYFALSHYPSDVVLRLTWLGAVTQLFDPRWRKHEAVLLTSVGHGASCTKCSCVCCTRTECYWDVNLILCRTRTLRRTRIETWPLDTGELFRHKYRRRTFYTPRK